MDDNGKLYNSQSEDAKSYQTITCKTANMYMHIYVYIF